MKIAFIGGGNMAAALVAGLAGKITPAASIHVVDPNPAALEALHARHGVTTAAAIDAAVTAAEVVVLAMKPQNMREAVAPLAALLAAASSQGKPAPLVLSIAAGIRIADLSRWLGGFGAIVRCMPNTPALIGMGVSGLVASAGVSAAQRSAADQVLQAVGTTVWLDDEAKIDAVTGLSGSGPAYVFYFIEAMQQAAVELGLTAEQGLALAKATFTGAAQLAARSDEPVTLLRERVTSKGGTTYAALTSMEASGVKAAIVAGVKAAAARSSELGEQLGKD